MKFPLLSSSLTHTPLHLFLHPSITQSLPVGDEMESIQEETHGLTISHIHHHRSSYEVLERSNRPISSLITLKSTRANRLLKLDLNKEKIKIYSFTS